MTTIAKAITSLNLKNENSYEFVVVNEPTTEAEYNAQVDYITGSDANGMAVISDSQLYTWAQVSAEKTALIAAQPMANLRTQRTAKLAETDYLALSDQTMSAEMTAYRQALRDLPNNYETTDSGALRQDLSNLRWPTKP